MNRMLLVSAALAAVVAAAPLIPNTTKNILYGLAGIYPIFCKASMIKFLWVSEEKNALGFDKKSSFSVAFKLSKLSKTLFAVWPLDHCHNRSEEFT